MHPRRRAFTLLELILGLVIMAIISTAVCALTTGSMNADRYMRAFTDSQSEVEFAMRRITNNIREAQTGSITFTATTLSTLTQADAAHGCSSGATVSYALRPDPSNASLRILVETDQRYGTNTLVHNVQTFSVSQVSGSSDLYQIDLVAGGTDQAARHFKVLARN
ncbi:MAG: PulJ/GspJ family protein [Phycisphaerae bacterium]